MSDPIILLLSLPPSANRLWRNNRLSPDYRKWKDTAGWEAKTQLVGVAPIKGKFYATIEVPENRRDPDNNVKPLLDLCQAVGAIKNDKLLSGLYLVPVEREGALITLSDADLVNEHMNQIQMTSMIETMKVEIDRLRTENAALKQASRSKLVNAAL